MSYMSQKPSCKAKVEGRGGPRVTGVFSFYCGRGICFCPEGKKPVEGDGI